MIRSVTILSLAGVAFLLSTVQPLSAAPGSASPNRDIDLAGNPLSEVLTGIYADLPEHLQKKVNALTPTQKDRLNVTLKQILATCTIEDAGGVVMDRCPVPVAVVAQFLNDHSPIHEKCNVARGSVEASSDAWTHGFYEGMNGQRFIVTVDPVVPGCVTGMYDKSRLACPGYRKNADGKPNPASTEFNFNCCVLGYYAGMKALATYTEKRAQDWQKPGVPATNPMADVCLNTFQAGMNDGEQVCQESLKSTGNASCPKIARDLGSIRYTGCYSAGFSKAIASCRKDGKMEFLRNIDNYAHRISEWSKEKPADPIRVETSEKPEGTEAGSLKH